VLPLHGFVEHRRQVRHVDPLSDEDLAELNRLLPWQAFTVDHNGRRFGDAAWIGKRDTPQPVPDARVLLLDEAFSLRDREVLEVGCFEGIHTLALAERARSVVALDARIENVVKTIVRCAFYGVAPTVFKLDVEDGCDQEGLDADVAFHVGVLYHLRDPVRHLLELGRRIRIGLLLDTHVARISEATESIRVDGKDYPCRRHGEGGVTDVFSGMYDHANWLTLPAILDLLATAGFPHVALVEERVERHGPRILLVASRLPVPASLREPSRRTFIATEDP
jgi:tRNA (mo5U34)-methyltransferase